MGFFIPFLKKLDFFENIVILSSFQWLEQPATGVWREKSKKESRREKVKEPETKKEEIKQEESKNEEQNKENPEVNQEAGNESNKDDIPLLKQSLQYAE